ncbi:MAG: tandem-95 repeat protein [Janthinobacterium lividum]
MKSLPALDHSTLDQTGAARPRRSLNRRAPAPLALEARVMFDGATADAAVAAAKAAVDIQVPDAHEASSQPSAFERQDLQVAAAVLPPESQRQEIVFVVDNVPDYQKMIAAVEPGVEVVVLDHTKDGLQQVIAALDGRAPVDAIHLVTHGEQQQIELGTSIITNASIDGYGSELGRIGQHLNAGGDLLVYGCNVAAGEAGAAFVDRLAQLTGADVAASTDVTGSSMFGGDWVMEASSGQVEHAAMALDRAGWSGELDFNTIFDVNYQPLTFANPVALVTGMNGTRDGDKMVFKNVFTAADGTVIDAIVTTKIDGVTIDKYDTASTSSSEAVSNEQRFFQPNLTATKAGGKASFTIAFYLGGNHTEANPGTAVTLQNVVVNSYDIDSSNNTGSDRQFQSFQGFAKYEILASGSNLDAKLDPNTGLVTFQAINAGNNTSVYASAYRVRVWYDAMSTFKVEAGVAGDAKVAYFAFDFSKGPDPFTGTKVVESPAWNLSYGTTDFQEAEANDGSIATSTTITLKNGTFKGAPGQDVTEFVRFDKVPQGLTPRVVLVDSTRATLSFTGKAIAHESVNDVNNVVIAFQNGAFSNNSAAAVTGATRTDLKIDFSDAPVDNTLPVVGPNQRFEYAENRDAAAGPIGTVQASDQEGAVRDFRFVNGTDFTQVSSDGYFSIDGNGRISLTDAGRAAGAASNDYETGANIFKHEVVAYDAADNRSAPVEVTLALANVDEAPPTVTITADDTRLKADQSTILHLRFSEAVTGFDVDDIVATSGTIGTTLTWVSATECTVQYTPGRDIAASDVEISVGAGRFADAADNDNRDKAAVTIRVDSAAPVIAGPDTAGNVVEIRENMAAVFAFAAQEAVSWNVEGADAALFEIGVNGALRFSEAPDFERPAGSGADANSYLVTVRATDAFGNTSAQALTVKVANADEIAPAFTSGAGAQAPENQNLLYQAAASDLVDYTNQKVTYSLAAGGDARLLAIDAASGAVTLAEGVLDFEDKDSYAFTVVATDDTGNASTRAVTVTVADENEAPVAGHDSITTPEDMPYTGGRLPVATDVDAGDTVTYAKASGPSYGRVEIDAQGGYTYTPVPDFNGQDSFTYTVSDGKGGSNTYTVNVTVEPRNDAPTAADGRIETDEDKAREGKLPQAGDVDKDAVTYALAQDGAPAHGSIDIDEDGSYTYTPGKDFHGEDSFRYTVSDGKGGSNTYTMTVTVNPLNDAPTAADGSLATDEDQAKQGKLPDARDADGDEVRYALASEGAPAHGSVEIGEDGSYTYRPGANFYGEDSFRYTVSDGKGGSNTYTMSVTVAPVNDAPTASGADIAVKEDTPFTGVLPPATDVEGDAVTYAKAGEPAHGTLELDERGNYTYTPDADYSGADSFSFTVSDGKGSSQAYTVAVTVGADNDAPVAADAVISTDEDKVASGALPAARDADGDIPVYSLATGPAHGTVDIGADGQYSYAPAANYHGADSFTYKVGDGKGGSNTYTVKVTVNPVNDAPTAADAGISVPEDGTVSGKLPEARDVEGDAVTYAKAGDPQHGTVTIDRNGNYTYTPHADYSGADRFTYTVSDGAASNTYTVTVTVGADNDAPVAADAALVTAEDTPYAGTLPAAFDADGDRPVYALAGAPAHGSVEVKAAGGYTYTPAADFNGKDSFTYTVSDGKGGSNTYTVDVTVTPVNDAPVAHGGAGGGATVGLPMAPVAVPAFTDVDSPSVAYTASLADGQPLPSWLAFDPDTRTFTGTPPAGSGGTWSVVVTGSDGALSATASVRIDVRDPAAPAQSLTIDAMSKDTGRSAFDFVTSDGSAGRTVRGSIGAPLGSNEVVQVSFDGGASWQLATTAGAGWSAIDGGAHGGDWTIVARVVNTAAGLSGAAVSVDVVLDTTAPDAPTVDDVSGASTTPVLGGAADVGPGEQLQVSVNGAVYEVTPVDGRWTLDLAGKNAGLEPGQAYAVTATVVDTAGNVRSGDGSVKVDAPQQEPQPQPLPEPLPVVQEAPPAVVTPVVAAPPAPLAPAVVPEPTPVQQAVDSRVSSELVAPGSLVGNDNTSLTGGQGVRREESAALDLRGAALSDIYTRSEGFRTVVARADEPALVLFQGVPDQFAESGRTLSMTVPADAFVHTQDKSTVRLAAMLQDGQPLPAWVHFNSETGKFTGEVPKGMKGELKIKLIARDQAGREAVALFRLNVGEERATSTDAKAAPAGKPDLSAQLRATSRALLRRG